MNDFMQNASLRQNLPVFKIFTQRVIVMGLPFCHKYPEYYTSENLSCTVFQLKFAEQPSGRNNQANPSLRCRAFGPILT